MSEETSFISQQKISGWSLKTGSPEAFHDSFKHSMIMESIHSQSCFGCLSPVG